MSAGAYTRGKIELSTGEILRCRIQPETAEAVLGGATNTEPAGALSANAYTINLRESRKKFGIHPASVTVELTADGTGDTAQYLSGTTHSIPALTPAWFNGINLGDVGTYLGIACEVISLNPENRV